MFYSEACREGEYAMPRRGAMVLQKEIMRYTKYIVDPEGIGTFIVNTCT